MDENAKPPDISGQIGRSEEQPDAKTDDLTKRRRSQIETAVHSFNVALDYSDDLAGADERVLALYYRAVSYYLQYKEAAQSNDSNSNVDSRSLEFVKDDLQEVIDLTADHSDAARRFVRYQAMYNKGVLVYPASAAEALQLFTDAIREICPASGLLKDLPVNLRAVALGCLFGGLVAAEAAGDAGSVKKMINDAEKFIKGLGLDKATRAQGLDRRMLQHVRYEVNKRLPPSEQP